MSIFINDQGISINNEEVVIPISYSKTIRYADFFYALNRGWEDKITIVDGSKKIIITKNKKGINEFKLKGGDIIMEISENGIGYAISSLMYYYHFKEARVNHIHIECDGKNKKTYDLTLFFENHLEPMRVDQYQ